MGLVSYLPRLWNYAGRAAKVWDVAVLGGGEEVLTRAYTRGLKNHKNIFTKDFYSNFWKTTKTAGKELEAFKAAKVAKHGSTWKVLGENFRNIPKGFKAGWASGAKYAARKGKNKFLSQLGGALKKGGKRIGKLLGPLLIVGFELPNIIKATKNEGIGSGLIETGKAAAKLGGWTLGAAIGQALIPIPGVGAIIGTIVGGVAGELLVSKIVGKSYSEKQMEQEEKIAQAVAQAQEQQQAAGGTCAGGSCSSGRCGGAQQTFAGNTPQVQPQQQPGAINPFIQYQMALEKQGFANPYQDDIMYNLTFNQPQRLNYQA